MPWAEVPTRTLIQRTFAWELTAWMREASHLTTLDDLRIAFQRARSSCSPQTTVVPPSKHLPELRVAYLPYDGSVEPAHEEHRWCLRVACANASWVTHCFGTMAHKMECAAAASAI